MSCKLISPHFVIHWLIYSSIFRLINWLTVGWIGHLLLRLTDNDWVANWFIFLFWLISIDRSIDQLIDWVIDRLIDQSIDWSIDWLIEWFANWLADNVILGLDAFLFTSTCFPGQRQSRSWSTTSWARLGTQSLTNCCTLITGTTSTCKSSLVLSLPGLVEGTNKSKIFSWPIFFYSTTYPFLGLPYRREAGRKINKQQRKSVFELPERTLQKLEKKWVDQLRQENPTESITFAQWVGLKDNWKMVSNWSENGGWSFSVRQVP